MPLRIAITTLGCKTNHYDSAAFLGRLDPAVYQQVPFDAEADVVIVNSCTVTAIADRQSRQLIYQARRRNPGALVIMSGCYAAVDGGSLSEIEEIDLVIPGRAPEQLFKAVSERARSLGYLPQEGSGQPLFEGQTRPYLKVQDGCEAHCSYCIIPRARGKVTSVPIPEVLASLKTLADGGVHEVVLTGIHVGQWGRDLPGRPPFVKLLDAIAESGVMERVRISSLEPMELSDEVIRVVRESESFCPHLHIPLQSGSDKILKRMQRPYLTRHYRERMEAAAAAIPGLGLGIDVIVGFPGEGAREVAESMAFLESLPFTYLHVFSYSERPGTPAADMDGQVTQKERKRRARDLIALGQERRVSVARAHVGKPLHVLVEHKIARNRGLFHGFSENYQDVLIDSKSDLFNKVIEITPHSMYNTSHRLVATDR